MSGQSRDGDGRLLQILQVLQPPDGGVAEHVYRLSTALVARGHTVTVAGPAGRLQTELEAVGAEYVPLPIVGNMLAPARDFRTLVALRRLVRRRTFDVVHTHAQKAGAHGRLAALWAGVPALYTPHALGYRSQLLRPRRAAYLRYRFSLMIERVFGRRAAAIVAVAEDERRDAIVDRLAPSERVHLVHYGVDVDRSLPPDPELVAFRGDGPLIGFVAGLREQKGLPTLLDALELLAADGAAPRFAIVGNGPLWDEVAARIAGGPLRETTLLAPFAGRMEPYLAALDVFVLPSYWEGLPIASLEAMAMGVPVIASAVNGTPEAVAHEETGLLVPAGDSAALAAAIRRLAEDADTRARFAAAGPGVVERRFVLERMVDELEALYRTVAKPPPNATPAVRERP